MKRLSIAIVITTLIGASACSSTRVGSAVKSTNSAKTITGAEWVDFAGLIAQTLNGSGVLARYFGQNGGRPVVLAIGDFDTNVGRMSQKDFARTKDVMYAALRKQLVNGTGGMVSVNMDVKGTGGRTDSLVQSGDQLRGSIEYDQASTTKVGQAQAYQLVLNGQIITIEYTEGRTDRFDYAVNVALIDAKTRGTVFEDQVLLPKEMTRGLFGL